MSACAAGSYPKKRFEALLSSWTPVSYTMNELNRSMGLGDAYPFELSRAVRESSILCTW